MQLAERYRRLPALLREQAVEPLAALLPSSELRRGRVRDLKRFLKSAALPPVERYFRWVSIFDTKTKNELYSKDLRRLLGNHDASAILEPWFVKANGNGM